MLAGVTTDFCKCESAAEALGHSMGLASCLAHSRAQHSMFGFTLQTGDKGKSFGVYRAYAVPGPLHTALRQLHL